MIRNVFVQAQLMLNDPKQRAELFAAAKPEEPLTAPTMNFGDGDVVRYGDPVSGLPWPESDAARVADYSGQATRNSTDEEPLVAPTMNFDDVERHCAKVPTTDKPKGQAGTGEDEPLLVPVMEF